LIRDPLDEVDPQAFLLPLERLTGAVRDAA
jgi:hypothetical protein